MNTSVAIPGPDPLPLPLVVVVLRVVFFTVTDPFMLVYGEGIIDTFVGMRAEMRGLPHDTARYLKRRRHYRTWSGAGRYILARARGLAS